jgi:hypothetical protein
MTSSAAALPATIALTPSSSRPLSVNLARASLDGACSRRADSGERGWRFALYEVAGALILQVGSAAGSAMVFARCVQLLFGSSGRGVLVCRRSWTLIRPSLASASPALMRGTRRHIGRRLVQAQKDRPSLVVFRQRWGSAPRRWERRKIWPDSCSQPYLLTGRARGVSSRLSTAKLNLWHSRIALSVERVSCRSHPRTGREFHIISSICSKSGAPRNISFSRRA